MLHRQTPGTSAACEAGSSKAASWWHNGRQSWRRWDSECVFSRKFLGQCPPPLLSARAVWECILVLEWMKSSKQALTLLQTQERFWTSVKKSSKFKDSEFMPWRRGDHMYAAGTRSQAGMRARVYCSQAAFQMAWLYQNNNIWVYLPTWTCWYVLLHYLRVWRVHCSWCDGTLYW